MKIIKTIFIGVIFLVVLALGIYFLVKRPANDLKFYQQQKISNEIIKNSATMEILSPTFKHNDFIPSKYTCDGGDINPPLEILGVPFDAQSLVLIVDDPDAPLGTWVHWLVWNIEPKTTKIEENSVPADAVEGTTSFGRIGYGGPCPPTGVHRYFFKLYALDITLNLPPSADKTKLLEAMDGHILAEAELIGLYHRAK